MERSNCRRQRRGIESSTYDTIVVIDMGRCGVKPQACHLPNEGSFRFFIFFGNLFAELSRLYRTFQMLFMFHLYLLPAIMVGAATLGPRV